MTDPEQESPDANSDDLAHLLSRIQTQQETIDYLVQYIERVEAQLTDRIRDLESSASLATEGNSVDGATVEWAILSGTKRLKAWNDLDQFVTSLVHRHRLGHVIRPCWYLHDSAVEELTVLW
ncbi:MAG TPA: hypothetical protein VH352_13335, partial [Pseudonocardiaceae bacterium]|nr:hypothetical protein [Pseudonocardiaceae bacterium]